MKKVIALSVVLFAFATGAFAQLSDTETANATATILTPLQLTLVTDLDFGTIVPNGTAGVVTMATTGTRTSTGPDLLTSAAGTVASFTVSGEANQTFDITLPADGTITLVSGANTMAADNFQHDEGATPTLDGTGAAGFNVGADLSVGAAQASGTYTTTFDVTVNYN